MRGIRREIFLFAIVGVVGFLVDAGVFQLLVGWLGLYFARVWSFLCAACTTWSLNRARTFRDRRSGRTPAAELAIYLSLMLGGGGINYAVYAAMVHNIPFVRIHPVLGIACGSLAGLAFNFASSRQFLFRRSELSLNDTVEPRSADSIVHESAECPLN
ncbi:MAG: GtrA family protein [Methylovirgula sp.]